MVPPYVDDLTKPRRDREPAGSGSGDLLAGDDSPAGKEAAAAAGRAVSDWSAWSSFRTTPAADELVERGAAAGGVTSGVAGAGDETGTDESAAAAPVTGVADDRRAGASDAEAGEPAPATAEAGDAVAAAVGAAGLHDPADGAGAAGEPGEAGAAADTAGASAAEAGGEASAEALGTAEEDAAQEDGAEEDAVEADDGAEADGAGASGRAGVASDGGGSADTGASEDAEGAADEAGTPLDDEVTIVPGVARYHRRGCILIRFLSDGDLETTTRGGAEATGLVPCKACQPDKPDSSA
jgi:hypothetical protein